MTRGEKLEILIDYDLFGLNIKGLHGIYINKTPKTEKLLVYIEENGEWAELLEQQVKRIKPGKVSKKNKEFISRVRKLGSSE